MNERIWKIGEARRELWEEDPARAARLAYLQVVLYWHEQVEAGMYTGVPNLHGENYRWPDADQSECETVPSGPAKVEPDEEAAAWLVPQKIRWVYSAAA